MGILIWVIGQGFKNSTLGLPLIFRILFFHTFSYLAHSYTFVGTHTATIHTYPTYRYRVLYVGRYPQYHNPLLLIDNVSYILVKTLTTTIH